MHRLNTLAASACCVTTLVSSQLVARDDGRFANSSPIGGANVRFWHKTSSCITTPSTAQRRRSRSHVRRIPPTLPSAVAACRIDRRRVSTARDDAVQENGTYGGQGKAGCVPPTALLFLSGRRTCARQEMDLGAATSKTLGSHPSVTHTSHTRHSNVCNSAKPPIFGIGRTNRRIATPQLGQHGAG
jgi:hypothetical protein